MVMSKRERLVKMMKGSVASSKTPPHLKVALRKKLKAMGE